MIKSLATRKTFTRINQSYKYNALNQTMIIFPLSTHLNATTIREHHLEIHDRKINMPNI